MGDRPSSADSTNPTSPSDNSSGLTLDSSLEGTMSDPQSSVSGPPVPQLPDRNCSKFPSDPDATDSESSMDLGSTDSEGPPDLEGSALKLLCHESLRCDVPVSDLEHWEARQSQATDLTNTIMSYATRNDPRSSGRPANRPVNRRSLIIAAWARKARIISPEALAEALSQATNPSSLNLTIAKRVTNTPPGATQSLAAVLEALKGTTSEASYQPETSRLIPGRASKSESDPSLTRSLAAADETPQGATRRATYPSVTTNLADCATENASSLTPRLAAVVESPPGTGQTTNPSDHTNLTNRAAENDPSLTPQGDPRGPQTPQGASQSPDTSDTDFPTDFTNLAVENDPSLPPSLAEEPETAQGASRQATSPSDTNSRDSPAKRRKFD